MKIIIFIATLSLFFVQNGCSQPSQNNTNYWLNTKYIRCLKENLPCECEKVVGTHFLFVLDTISTKKYPIASLKFDQMEPHFYRLKRSGKSKFDILLSANEDDLLGTLVYNQDTLMLIEDGKTSKYLNTSSSSIFTVNGYLKDNVKFINKALVDRGYSSLEIILKRDSLRCSCNKWMGYLNLLSIKGMSDSWILRLEQDSLVIYEITNKTEDAETPLELKKIEAFDWQL